MSGRSRASQSSSTGSRARTEFTFQVAMRIVSLYRRGRRTSNAPKREPRLELRRVAQLPIDVALLGERIRQREVLELFAGVRERDDALGGPRGNVPSRQ